MTGDETKSCFCLDETEASKAELNRLADELSEIYPLYLEHKSTGSACQDIPQLKTAASALIKEFTKLLHALDEYGDGELTKTARRMSYALARFDYLNGANYEALVSAVKSFACMLPSTGGINAKEAARLMNRIKMGYFPTDPEHVRLIKSAVKFPDRRVNLLDPCCGEGLALKEFSDGENAVTYGIEIDGERVRAARENLDRAVSGSFFASRVPYGRFHAVFLNPPYLSCPGPDGSRRMERAFLSDILPYLMKGGLLIYIIPSHRATEQVCGLLASYFKNISVYRFRDSEYRKFSQIVFFGIRTEKHSGQKTAKRIEELTLSPEKIPLIDKLPEKLYSLPDKESEVPYFRGSVFDTAELSEYLKTSDSLSLLFEEKALESRVMKPLLPLNLSQIGLVGASGLMNGLVDCEHPHVIKGRVIKQKKTNLMASGDSDKAELREVESNKMIFNILTPDGYIKVS